MTVAFRQDLLGGSSVLEVSIAWNADTVGDPLGLGWTWTDETAKVYFATKIKITQGRADETSQAAPCNIGLTLLNDLNAYSAYNPLSTHAQNGARNTPIRVRVNLGAGAVVLGQGYIIGLTPTWDVSGKLPLVVVNAAGILRRLGQGKTPLRSPLYRANMHNASSLIAYWPMEEGSNATQCAAATPGTQPLSRTGAGTVKFGASGAAGAVAMCDFTGRGQLVAPVPVYSATSFAINYTFGFTDQVQIDQVLMFSTSTGMRFYVRFYPTIAGGNTFVFYYSAATGATGGTSAVGSFSTWPDFKQWYTQSFSFRQNGADVDIYVRLENGTEYLGQKVLGETLGVVRTVTVNPGDYDGTVIQSAFTLGHVAITAPAPHPMTHTAALAGASIAYAGELADARMVRLCAEENVPLIVNGTSTQAMGPQGIASLVDLLLETAKADGGPLYDGFGPGLQFNTLSSRYNIAASLTADVPSGQLSPPFAPVDDDQRTVNDFTASKPSGTFAHYADTTSALSTLAIGLYDSADTFNVYDDASLASIAGWRVHQGTVAGLRYPNAAYEFAITAPSLAAGYLAAAPRIGWRADITNVTTSAPTHPPGTVSQIVEGMSTTVDPFSWSVVATCSPYAPWANVATVDDATIICGSEDTTVHAGGITSGGLSLVCDVVTVWSTSGADYPIDLSLGGERVTCSGVAGAGPTQTFTLTARGVGGTPARAHVAGEAVDAWSSAIAAI